jgi:paraquat-inducible protein B
VVEIEPERILERGALMKRAPGEAFQAMVKQGLRARLQTGNMLTGQLFVDLVMQPKAPLRLTRAERPEPELPTIRGANLEQAMVSASSIMEKIDSIDLVNIGAELNETLKGTNSLLNGPQLQSALADLSVSLASLRTILRAVDSHAEPIAANLEQTLVAARAALEKSKTTMALVDGAIAPESPLYFHAVRLAQELAQTSRSLRNLVDMLERNPQALLLGKPPAKEP